MSKLYKSILKNYLATTFGLGVTFLNQIAMVPLYIKLWGVDKYADWILITALSSFFTMTDAGLNQATNNEFVIKYQQKDFATCAKLQTNTFLFILLVCCIFILASIIVSILWGFKGILGVRTFSEIETSIAFILLLLNVFVMMFGRVYHAVFRAVSKTHIAIVTDNIIRLLSIIIMFLGILWKMNIIYILVLYSIPAIPGVIFKHIYANKIFSIDFSFRKFDGKIFKSMLKPSIAFMLMPLGFAIQNQGMVFIVNALLGTSVLVIFTTTRTLVNFLRQLMNLLSFSINPEIAVAYGRKNNEAIRNIYYNSLIITFTTTVISLIVLLFIGKFIYLHWTNNAILFDSSFFTGMLFVLLISCLWGVSSVIPQAINRHERFTIVFLFSQGIGVVLCFFFLKVYPHLASIPPLLFLTEMSLFAYTLVQNNKLLNTNFSEMCADLLTHTKFLFKKGFLLIRKAI